MAKKKGKKGKKGKKKGKKNAEPEMTFKEAILAYQIGIKERQIEEVTYEVKGMEERNKRIKEQNARLKEEQKVYMQHLLKQSREYQDYLKTEEIVGKELVVAAMKEKWVTKREEEKKVIVLQEEDRKMDRAIADEEAELAQWNDYRVKGHLSHQTQITVLEQELNDMQHAFNEMAGHLVRTLEKTKVDIVQNTDQTMDLQKLRASEKAMASMDKHSQQEVLDNEWLKRETAIHQREHDKLLTIVGDLEKTNLEIMSQLFECKVEDLKISRNFFLTQFGIGERLDSEGGILEIDLSRMTVDDEEDQTSSQMATSVAERPKSAVQKAVEDKVFSLTDALAETAEQDEDEEEEEEDDRPELDNYFNLDDEDFNAYLQLGPLELKLLNVQGQKASLHQPVRPPTAEQVLKACNPDDWPITHPMLNRVFNPTRLRDTDAYGQP